MRFQFDANQTYQLRAVASVVDLFQGLRRHSQSFRSNLGMFNEAFEEVAFGLDDTRLLANLRKVQEANQLTLDDELRTIEVADVDVNGKKQKLSFPNFSVEMETGTGKTYVYLRTALELHRRYGLQKFIIVVPSVAVREGVLKTFKITQGHFEELFDNVPYRADVYESKNLNRLRAFAEDDGIRFLIMTIDSFNKEQNVIRQSTDRLQGRVGLHLLQGVRPVLILDEPQNMESAARKQALALLNPLAALRYSATHRDHYNLVYRLSPFDAYRQGLVKKIEVASVVKEDDFNQVYVRVKEIRSAKNTFQARIAIHQRMAGGAIKEKDYLFKPGDNLEKKAERSEYASFKIDEINPGEGCVKFSNGLVVKEGEARGGDEKVLFREQIRYTVEAHFRRQEQLREQGIKVLSLIFIDRVENYTAEDGLIRKLFDEAFEDIKPKYPAWANRKPAEARGAYFAAKKRKGVVEYQDSTSGDNAEDRAAYSLIMREKERLLSFEEPVCFVFSHSALKEGWDNPNVFQICTLNQTTSEIKKRQEVGRGMRLAVNQKGTRVTSEKVNLLTVVANESYEDYVKSLQAEIAEEFGEDEAKKIRPTNARQKKVAIRKPMEQLPEAFRQLWEKIKHRTRYRVKIDTPALVKEVVQALNGMHIEPPRVVVTKARVEADRKEDAFLAMQVSGAKTVANLAGRFPLPNLVERIGELLEHVTPPVRLTRLTILEIVGGVKDPFMVLDNPEEFALRTAQVIRDRMEQHLVKGIQYEKDGTWYEMSEWSGEIETSSDRTLAVTKSLYDHLVYDSEVEKRFAETLEKMEFVKFFVKLPAWFKVRTPVGNYNPDWAVVREDRDQFGDEGEQVYLIAETKGADLMKLYVAEQQKVECGKRHFHDALDVNYEVVQKAEQLKG